MQHFQSFYEPHLCNILEASNDVFGGWPHTHPLRPVLQLLRPTIYLLLRLASEIPRPAWILLGLVSQFVVLEAAFSAINSLWQPLPHWSRYRLSQAVDSFFDSFFLLQCCVKGCEVYCKCNVKRNVKYKANNVGRGQINLEIAAATFKNKTVWGFSGQKIPSLRNFL